MTFGANMASNRNMQPKEERALRNITSDVVNVAPTSRQVFSSSINLMKTNDSRAVTEETLTRKEGDVVDNLASMAVPMHDHEAGNSCSCMEENKEGNIKTIYSYKAGQGV